METTLTLQPIGFIRTEKQVKFDALHQPAEDRPERNFLELLPGRDYELALRDLEGFSRVWLVWWFHRNQGWRPLVLPPRGPAKRRGVFATRSPYRPNPLGLTPVPLIAVEKGRLVLGPCDLVDGTPVFDIKPYIAAYDSFPGAGGGWTEEVDRDLARPPAFSVALSPLAKAQAEWLLGNWGIDYRERMFELLARDPAPHRTRRIRRRKDGRMEIGCGAWRGYFSAEDARVDVTALDAAYPLRFLNDPTLDYLPDRAAQLAFLARWPSPYGD